MVRKVQRNSVQLKLFSLFVFYSLIPSIALGYALGYLYFADQRKTFEVPAQLCYGVLAAAKQLKLEELEKAAITTMSHSLNARIISSCFKVAVHVRRCLLRLRIRLAYIFSDRSSLCLISVQRATCHQTLREMAGNESNHRDGLLNLFTKYSSQFTQSNAQLNEVNSMVEFSRRRLCSDLILIYVSIHLRSLFTIHEFGIFMLVSYWVFLNMNPNENDFPQETIVITFFSR